MNQRSQFTRLASASAVFCLCIQKTGTTVRKAWDLNITAYSAQEVLRSQSVATHRLRSVKCDTENL